MCLKLVSYLTSLPLFSILIYFPFYLPLRFVFDLKLMNMVLGLQNHSSIMSCPYGLCYKVDGRWVEGEPRTMRMCKNMHEGYVSQFPEGDSSQLRNYGGCKNPPIDIFPEEKADVPIIKLIAPPILHLLLG